MPTSCCYVSGIVGEGGSCLSPLLCPSALKALLRAASGWLQHLNLLFVFAGAWPYPLVPLGGAMHDEEESLFDGITFIISRSESTPRAAFNMSCASQFITRGAV